jgi:hypothetical protein
MEDEVPVTTVQPAFIPLSNKLAPSCSDVRVFAVRLEGEMLPEATNDEAVMIPVPASMLWPSVLISAERMEPAVRELLPASIGVANEPTMNEPDTIFGAARSGTRFESRTPYLRFEALADVATSASGSPLILNDVTDSSQNVALPAAPLEVYMAFYRTQEIKSKVGQGLALTYNATC